MELRRGVNQLGKMIGNSIELLKPEEVYPTPSKIDIDTLDE